MKWRHGFYEPVAFFLIALDACAQSTEKVG